MIFKIFFSNFQCESYIRLLIKSNPYSSLDLMLFKRGNIMLDYE
jgi:hypothetical protein